MPRADSMPPLMAGAPPKVPREFRRPQGDQVRAETASGRETVGLFGQAATTRTGLYAAVATA